MDFTIVVKGHIEDDEAHLMHFVPDKIQTSLSGTKFQVDRITVTKESEPSE